MEVVLYISAILTIGIIYLLSRIVPFFWNVHTLRRALLKLVPADEHHWLYGHLHVFPGPNHDGLLHNIAQATKYPRYYLFLIGPIRTVVQLNHPETIKPLAKRADSKQLDIGGYNLLKPWIGEGLLISTGAKWQRNRKLLTPAFHFDVLKQYYSIYNECVDTLIDIIEKQAVKTGQSIDVFQRVPLCTLDVILRCAFSVSKDIQRDEGTEYVNTITTLAEQVYHRVMKPHLYLDMIYYRTNDGKAFQANCNYSHKFAMNLINKRKQNLAVNSSESTLDNKDKRIDFLDILLLARDEDGNGLTEQEILDEVETFTFGGHDTTGSGICWILYNLARHPDIQTHVQAEIDGLLDGRESKSIEWNDMSLLPYLTQCIKESLRLHPPVPFTGRQLAEPLQIDDKILPTGALVDINIWNLHHNPAVWENPMQYDPDRFLPENIAKMDSYAFLPFSAGPRNCIGQNFAMNEMKTMVARILHQFRISVDGTKEVRMKPKIVLHAENGIHLYFRNRILD